MLENLLEVNKVSFTYDEGTADELEAVKDISFSLARGEHIAILGRNGSGKSSLARLLNALLLPQRGNIVVMGLDTSDPYAVWDIRSKLGMVFQNPDNQIVATTVEEDVAFGLENLGLANEEMIQRVSTSLAQLGLESLAERQPSDLSGGQKQKLALAGVLAMQPDCIILDEATSMLDPRSRRELLQALEQIRVEKNISIINVTHHMDEVLLADEVLLMSQGALVMRGTPAELFFEVDTIHALGLDVPAHMEIAKYFADQADLKITPEDIASEEKAYAICKKALQKHDAFRTSEMDNINRLRPSAKIEEDIIVVKNLSHTYNANRLDEVKALSDISFSLKKGEFLGIAGHTGSGKSTLIQHLNALIRPEEGTVFVLGMDASSNKNIPSIRSKLGMVFQYPEQQLFAETILDDVSYGPKQMGVDAETAKARSLEALAEVGLADLDYNRSPFELSGGQMRRVAIAGILAMQPDILVLDEPAAGLDPQGREEIFSTLKALQARGISIIFVSHSMDDLAKLSDRIMVLRNGSLKMIDNVANVFSNPEFVLENNLEVPRVMQFASYFKCDNPNFNERVFTVEELIQALIQAQDA